MKPEKTFGFRHRNPSGAIVLAILILLVWLIFSIFIGIRLHADESFIIGDCYYYQATIVSLLQDKDFVLENNIPGDLLNGQLALGRDGIVSKHPVLMPLVSLPFYLLFGSYGLLLFNVLQSTLLVVLIYLLNLEFFPRRISFWTSLIFASTTLFLNYSFNYSPDIFSTAIFLGGLLALFKARPLLGATLLGFSIFAKITNSIPVLLLIVYQVQLYWLNLKRLKFTNIKTTDLFSSVRPFILVFILSIIPFFLANYFLYGSMLVTGYQTTAIHSSHDSGIAIMNHASKFNQPIFSGLKSILFDSSVGLIKTNPALIIAFIGIFLPPKTISKDKWIVLLLVCLSQIILFAKFDDWKASHYSNRYLMTTVAISSVFFSSFLQRCLESSWPHLRNHSRRSGNIRFSSPTK